MDDSRGVPIRDKGLSRFDWERLVRRSELEWGAKYLALVLGTYAEVRDGSRCFPGRDRLVLVSGRSKNWVGHRMELLREEGWIVTRQGNRHCGRADEHLLAVPVSLCLVLDPDEVPVF